MIQRAKWPGHDQSIDFGPGPFRDEYAWSTVRGAAQGAVVAWESNQPVPGGSDGRIGRDSRRSEEWRRFQIKEGE